MAEEAGVGFAQWDPERRYTLDQVGCHVMPRHVTDPERRSTLDQARAASRRRVAVSDATLPRR